MMNDPQPGEYMPPVSGLLTLGRPRDKRFADWPDYVGLYGLTSEHIPELIRLVEDETFMQPEYHNRPESYAFVYALRGLGQLRDEAALPFLLQLAETEQDSDWIWEAIPYAIAFIGPSALPRLEASLEKMKQSITGLTLVDCIEKMAELHPETRDACIALLTTQLEQAADNHESVNANIISTLVDWKAMDSLPVIERAFATDNVDLMVMGDFDDVQVEFGLKAPDPNKPRYVHPAMQQAMESLACSAAAERSTKRNANARKKAKRKQTRQARKRNRKRK